MRNAGLPGRGGPLSRRRAILKIEIDEGLVGNPELARELLEVVDRLDVQADRDLLLELLGVRVGGRVREVVGLSHFRHSHCFIELL